MTIITDKIIKYFVMLFWGGWGFAVLLLLNENGDID